MSAPKIAFICGSLREGSINKTLEKALIKLFKRAGVSCSVIDLAEYEMPLYNGNLNTPDTVKTLINRVKKFDGVVIVSPEYNGSLPPLLKNMIDWTSTVDTSHIKTPYYGIASCTPGPMSGIMCMRQINYILMRLGGHVSPVQVGCGRASLAFDEKGELIAEPSLTLANNLIKDMLDNIGT